MVSFFVKVVYKRVMGWPSGWSLPVQNFVEYAPGRNTANYLLQVMLSSVFCNCTAFRIFKGMVHACSLGQF